MFLAYYLVAVNAVAALLFASDKFSACLRGWRVPEWLLHLFEYAGGALIVFPLIFILRHKNKKPSYFLVTGALFAGWVFLLVYTLT